MRPPFEQATFLKRYKRFLADVRRADGTEMTVHCANSGSMRACQFPGAPCLISDSGNPKRKLRFTLEAIGLPDGGYVGVNTGRPNGLVAEALRSGLLTLSGGPAVDLRAEVRYGDEKSRIDWLVEHDDGPPTFVEVKGISLVEEGDWGLFPDAVTSRGQKHLRELMRVARRGGRAALVFAVMRPDAARVWCHDGIDPTYGELFSQARKQGVEIHAVAMEVNATGFRPRALLPVQPKESP